MTVVIKDAMMSCEVLEKASPISIAALASSAGLRQLAKGEHLFWDKERVPCLYFAIEGFFSLYKQNDLGERRVVFVCGPGQMLNEAALQALPASISCEALSDAQVLYVPVKFFVHAMSEDFSLCQAVMDSMSIKIRRLYRQLKNTTGSLRIDKRIAAKLWKLSRDYGVADEDGTRIDLELTITYLADMLGAKRETVSRQMKLLADAGLVLHKSSTFIIPDRDRLKEYFKTP